MSTRPELLYLHVKLALELAKKRGEYCPAIGYSSEDLRRWMAAGEREIHTFMEHRSN